MQDIKTSHVPQVLQQLPLTGYWDFTQDAKSCQGVWTKRHHWSVPTPPNQQLPKSGLQGYFKTSQMLYPVAQRPAGLHPTGAPPAAAQ